MFNMDDFERMSETNNEVPDGIIDASDYYNDMQIVTNILSGIDYDDMNSRMHGMMNLMNSTYDDDGDMNSERVTGVVIALSFHFVNLMNNLEQESRDDYFNFAKNELLEQIKDDVASLPYWDLEETESDDE